MKYTPRLGLPQWDVEDRILREDFNGIGAAEEKLLSAATAAAYGLSNTAVPDAVLEKLKASVLFQSGALKNVLGANITIPATQISERARIASGILTLPNANASTSIYTGFQPVILMAFSVADYGTHLSHLPSNIGALFITFSASSINYIILGGNSIAFSHSYNTTGSGFVLTNTGGYSNNMKFGYVAIRP